MSMALQHRVASLESEVRALREIVNAMNAPISQVAPQHTNPNGPRSMCPRCGLVPAYHLHVIHCKGKK